MSRPGMLLATGLIWAGATGATLGAEAPPLCGKPLPAVVATVEAEQIPRSAVLVRLKTPDLNSCRQALDEAIRAALVRREAEAYRLRVTSAEVRIAADEFRKGFASDEALERFLAEREAGEADLERMIEDRVVLKAIDERQINAWVFADSLQEDYFSRHRAELAKNRVKVAHILVPTRQEAERIVGEMKTKDRTFADFAGYYSVDAKTREQGGDLGWIERGTMPKPFDDAAFAAEVGVVAPPVQSSLGWHLIKVEDRKRGADQTLDDHRARVIRLLQEEEWGLQRDEWWSELRGQAHVWVTPELVAHSPDQSHGHPETHDEVRHGG